MIVDVHTHVWPGAVATRALAAPSADLPRRGDGTVDGLTAAMQRGGVDRSVCLGVANTPDRVENANRFAGSLDGQRFVGFGSLHPGMGPEETVDSLRRHHLQGVKVHPLFQGYGIDDPRLWAIFEALEDQFVVVMHVGGGGRDATNDLSTPTKLRQVVRQFPRLKLVACHFGGYRLFDQAEALVAGLPVYVDTSWPPGLASLDRQRVRAFVERHGPERVIFGSDWPMAEPADEVQAVEALGLSAEHTEAILGRNLQRLLGLEEMGSSR